MYMYMYMYMYNQPDNVNSLLVTLSNECNTQVLFYETKGNVLEEMIHGLAFTFSVRPSLIEKKITFINTF